MTTAYLKAIMEFYGKTGTTTGPTPPTRLSCKQSLYLYLYLSVPVYVRSRTNPGIYTPGERARI